MTLQITKLLLLVLLQSFFFASAMAQDNRANTDIKQAEDLNRQSGKLYVLHQYDEALNLAVKELALREKIGDEQFIAAVNFNIGGIYRQKGDLEEAVKFFEIALAHYRRALAKITSKFSTA